MRAIIVDDQIDAISVLQNAIDKVCGDLEVVKVFQDINEAREFIISQPLDLVFLDVEIPPHTGFDLLEQLRGLDPMPSIIFVTAYDKYAIKAIKHAAFDYLLKPVDPEELCQTLEIFRSKQKLKDSLSDIRNKVDILLHQLEERKYRFSTRSGFKIIPESDILFVEADGSYSILHLTSGEQVYLSVNLKTCHADLNQEVFIRVSRGFVVNKEHVVEVNRKKGEILLNTDSQELVSVKGRVL